MTQQFPVSATVIYDVLSADTAFTDLLGTYKFKGNSNLLTALSVVTPGEDLPSLRNVRGVECVIQDVGTTSLQPYLTDTPDLVTTFSVYCVAWEPSRGSNLQDVTNYIVRRFVGAQSIQTVATPDGLGSLVQAQVIIKSNMPIYPV